MPKSNPKESHVDVVAVPGKGEVPIAEIVRDFVVTGSLRIWLAKATRSTGSGRRDVLRVGRAP